MAGMKIAVIGAGAMGQAFGTRFIQAGEDVLFIDVFEPAIDAINAHGVTVVTESGPTHVPARASTSADAEGVVDFVLFFTKSMHTAAAIQGAMHLFDEHTIGLTLQNGLGNGEPLLEVFGPDRTLVGVTDYSATREPDGSIHSSDYGAASLGDYVTRDEPSEAAHEIYDLFVRAGFHTNLRENIHIPIWTKLIFNTVLNTIGGATGMTVAQTESSEPGVRLVEAVLAESLAVAHAHDIPVGEEKLRTMLADVFESIPEHKTSMTVDIEAGRPTEIETIGGAVVAAAREKGVPVPVLATLVDVVRARTLAAGA